LSEEQAWELVRLVADWPSVVEQAARDKDPSRITTALYEVAKSFGRFYHDLPVLNAPDAPTVAARLVLSPAVLQVLHHGFDLVNVPFLDAM